MSAKQWARKNAKPVSNAEWTLRKAFSELNLLFGSFQNDDFSFNPEIFDRVRVKGTNIDRHYPNIKGAIFFDGPHHKTERQENLDEIITRVLTEDFGYTVKRWGFEKMNLTLARTIAKEAKEFLLGIGYFVAAGL